VARKAKQKKSLEESARPKPLCPGSKLHRTWFVHYHYWRAVSITWVVTPPLKEKRTTNQTHIRFSRQFLRSLECRTIDRTDERRTRKRRKRERERLRRRGRKGRESRLSRPVVCLPVIRQCIALDSLYLARPKALIWDCSRLNRRRRSMDVGDKLGRSSSSSAPSSWTVPSCYCPVLVIHTLCTLRPCTVRLHHDGSVGKGPKAYE